MAIPRPVDGILDIAPYVGGRSHSPHAARTYKLSSNESPLGPSPRAIEAYTSAAQGLHLYPDGSAAKLRDAIAETYGLNAERIVCGNGSDELLHLLPLCYCAPGDEVLFGEHAFLVYRIAALAAGATPVVAPAKDRAADVDALLARVSKRTRIVFLDNPNNPTGTYLPASEVRRLHAALPDDVLLVIDAAYAEYVRRNDYETGIELVATSDNVVMTRTFSKIHGLAGLRLGWAYGPAHVVDVLNRTRGPFNVSIPAQAAGIAALRDKAHVEQSIQHNDRWREWLRAEIAALGLTVDASVGNFLLVHFPTTEGKSAADADAWLMHHGVILRGVGAYGLPHCLRITVGTEEANRQAVALLAEFTRR